MEQNQQPQPPEFTPQQPVQQYQPRVTARPLMEPVEAVKTCLRKFFDFTGRARRSEYWWFVLFTFIISWVFSFLGNLHTAFTFIGLLVGLVLFIPQFSAMTRRLHDTGRSGWWAVVTYLALLVFYGAFAVMLLPHAKELMTDGDDMKLVMTMANAVQESPVAMTVAAISGVISSVMAIITLVFTVLDSHWTENKYGPSPKYK